MHTVAHYAVNRKLVPPNIYNTKWVQCLSEQVDIPVFVIKASYCTFTNQSSPHEENMIHEIMLLVNISTTFKSITMLDWKGLESSHSTWSWHFSIGGPWKSQTTMMSCEWGCIWVAVAFSIAIHSFTWILMWFYMLLDHWVNANTCASFSC